MRDINSFPGPKVKVNSFEEALEKVREIYPGATREGSTGAYSFSHGGEIVGEMWLARKKGWWLRIKKLTGKKQIKQIYTKIFDDMLKGDLEAIDNHLKIIKLEELSSACIHAILMATITIKDRLPTRKDFLEKSKEFIGQQYSNDEAKDLDRYK